jgi:ATP-dependent exoDNAse (exonuclease V) beta subunit
MDFGLPKVLVDNSSAVEGFGVEAKSVYDQKKQEELLDNVNVLYVALTRAEEQLYVISNMNLSRKGAQKIICVLFFINYLMNKGVLMQINCIMSLEATKLSNKAKHVDTSKAIRVVAEVLNPKNIK